MSMARRKHCNIYLKIVFRLLFWFGIFVAKVSLLNLDGQWSSCENLQSVKLKAAFINRSFTFIEHFVLSIFALNRFSIIAKINCIFLSDFDLVNGQFHVTFSLRWTVGHRFRSNFGRAFINRKKVSSQNFSSKKIFWRFYACFTFRCHFTRTKTLFCIFCTKCLNRYTEKRNLRKFFFIDPSLW